MSTFKTLYDRACKKGKLRKDEYSTQEYIDDVNDLGRRLWTMIFQGVNGNVPKKTRTETFVVTGDTTYTHTRTIKKTPILKIVYEDCHVLTQKTNKILNDYGNCMFSSYEYDDDEIRFDESANGTYVVYYESPNYVELTLALYNADEIPTWIKDDFVPLFWIYPAYLNTDTKKAEMGELYQMILSEFTKYYNRTETLEDEYMIACDNTNQL